MAIFQREGGDTPSPAAGPSGRPAPTRTGQQTTVVAAGSRVQGEISGTTDVLIDGQVEGQLVLGSDVVVGDGGEVLGQIQAQRVRVSGRVKGDIRASDRIEVMASGRIEGDVSAPRVAINAGAFFKGKVEMASEAPEPKPEPKPEPGSEPKPEPKPAVPPRPEPEQKRLDDGGAPSTRSAGADS